MPINLHKIICLLGFLLLGYHCIPAVEAQPEFYELEQLTDPSPLQPAADVVTFSAADHDTNRFFQVAHHVILHKPRMFVSITPLHYNNHLNKPAQLNADEQFARVCGRYARSQTYDDKIERTDNEEDDDDEQPVSIFTCPSFNHLSNAAGSNAWLADRYLVCLPFCDHFAYTASERCSLLCLLRI